ncbi:hypothetical protein [Methylomicrobium sp. Wu6]|uniref:hypothetical protein n=1 Tax=Methylomicrobium sp. Wu6 TaxID=3107928 RepID=UPI002DD6898D|nr:hypothetical protein [Methylomicrobium sp. Wu6]MEC4746959.1 hypothetical protein [Methylomicrobium sp. Wu6]
MQTQIILGIRKRKIRLIDHQKILIMSAPVVAQHFAADIEHFNRHASAAALAGVVNIRSDQRDRIRKTDDRFILFAGLIEQPNLISLRQIIADLKDRVNAAMRFRVDASEYLHRFRIVLAEEFTLVLGDRITLFEQFDQQVCNLVNLLAFQIRIENMLKRTFRNVGGV